MFTGIVQGIAKIESVQAYPGLTRLAIPLGTELSRGLKLGASVSVDGVCLTAAAIDGDVASFDVIQETIHRTTLSEVRAGQHVNIERAAKFGDEIGGHLLSGHIFDTATIEKIEHPPNNMVMTLRGKVEWLKYLFPKGYIAIDGISLTLAEIHSSHTFTIHLIPETLRMTTLGNKQAGEKVNIEIDAQTQAIVDTVERINGRSALYDRPAAKGGDPHTKTPKIKKSLPFI